MTILKSIPTTTWQEIFSEDTLSESIQALEDGKVLYFPALAFQLKPAELDVLSPQYANPKSKNISFNLLTNEVRGIAANISQDKTQVIRFLLERFAKQTHEFINKLFPTYKTSLIIGRTSFRPVEITDRVSSYRKDDKRLHVDAFPANPNQGLRILRVFSNINPNNQARIWRLGEPFAEVARQFLPRFKKPIPGFAHLLKGLGITKRYRTRYDHYMLQLHDHMKADVLYQKKARQQEVHFPSNTTWIVQTDHVSHAAMSGQHLLEQTFYLPITAMLDENKSPLRMLENLLKQTLI